MSKGKKKKPAIVSAPSPGSNPYPPDLQLMSDVTQRFIGKGSTTNNTIGNITGHVTINQADTIRVTQGDKPTEWNSHLMLSSEEGTTLIISLEALNAQMRARESSDEERLAVENAIRQALYTIIDPKRGGKEVLVNEIKEIGMLLRKIGVKLDPDSSSTPAIIQVANIIGKLVEIDTKEIVSWFPF